MSETSKRAREHQVGKPFRAKAWIRAWKGRGVLVHVQAPELDQAVRQDPSVRRSWEIYPAPVSASPACDPKPPPPVERWCPEPPKLSWCQRLLVRIGLGKLVHPQPDAQAEVAAVETTVFQWDHSGAVQIVSAELQAALERAKKELEVPGPVRIHYSPRPPVEVLEKPCDPLPPIIDKSCLKGPSSHA